VLLRRLSGALAYILIQITKIKKKVQGVSIPLPTTIGWTKLQIRHIILWQRPNSQDKSHD